MNLFGPSLESLSRQQNYYDSLYGQANEANANAISQAQQEQVRMALGQRRDQAQQEDTAQQQDWQANQNALQRQAATQDVKLQYQGAQKDEQMRQYQQDFTNATKDAMSGALPVDPQKLKVLYPHFDDSKINQLYQLAGSAAVARLQQAANNATKTGQPLDATAMDAAGIPPGTDFEKQAHPIIATQRLPFEQDATRAQTTADTANAAQKIESLRLPAPPVGGQYASGSWTRPVTSLEHWAFPGVSPDQIAQPNPDAVNRMKVALAAGATAATGPNATLQGAPGAYASTIPPNWRPSFAPNTATNAPAAPTPPPAAQGPKVRVKSPAGQFGFIPQSQVQAALAAGYTLAQAQ